MRTRGCALAMVLMTATTSGVAAHPRPWRIQPPASAAQANPLVERLIAASPAERRLLLDANSDDLTEDLQRALNEKASALRRAQSVDEAIRAYGALRALTERRGDRVGLAMSLVGYSAIPGQRAEYPAAIAASFCCIPLARAATNRRCLGVIRARQP